MKKFFIPHWTKGSGYKKLLLFEDFRDTCRSENLSRIWFKRLKQEEKLWGL